MTVASRAIDMPHLAARLFGAPLAMSRSKLEVVAAAVGPRLLEGGPLPMTAGPAPERQALEVSADGIATISVEGSLVRRGGFAAWSGMSTYESIGSEVDQAASDPRVRGVLLAIDSPGGEVAGLFDLVAKIEALGESKPVFAVADEEAYSAAYAIATAADCIYVARTGGVGSVGIVALHVDQSGADAKKGLSYTYVHGGAKKVDGHSHAPLTDAARGDLQAEVDRLHAIFAETVAANRDMPMEDVMATEAGVYMGQAAVDEGLADEVGTLEDATQALRAEITSRRMMMNMRQMLGLAPEADETAMASALEGKLAELAASKASAEKATAENAKLSARLGEIETAKAAERHDRMVERVDSLRERGAKVDEHLAQEDRADLIAALESGNDREKKLGETLFGAFRARVESAEKVRGGAAATEGSVRAQSPSVKVVAGGKSGSFDRETEDTKEQMLRAQGFDLIVKDAQGRILLEQCSSPEGRAKKGQAAASK